MLKANSLLYAVYVCLIVSLLCAGLLYLSTLYLRLNEYYNTSEELIIQNESLLNFVLANTTKKHEGEFDDQAYKNSFSVKEHGLLQYVITQSFFRNDTLQKVHFIGKHQKDHLALYVPKSSFPVNYSGNVVIDGDYCLPYEAININYATTGSNSLKVNGNYKSPAELIPSVKEDFIEQFLTIKKNIINNKNSYQIQNDTINTNSFTNSPIFLAVPNELNQLKIEGNFIIYNKNFINIGPETQLNDVVVFAPKILIKKGFKGTAQFLATEELIVEDDVFLHYPSVLGIYNTTENKSLLLMGENVTLQGLICSFGYKPKNIADNEIKIGVKSTILGLIYCYGNLTLQANVVGTVYTNKISGKTISGHYENSLINVNINNTKLPSYFVQFDLLDNHENNKYGVIKKTY